MNTTAKTTALLSALVIGAFALTACGGGGSTAAMTPRAGMEPAPTTNRTTEPIAVSFKVGEEDVSLSSIHMEMTDLWIYMERPRTLRSGITVDNLYFADVVCPGLAHNGNQCGATRVLVDLALPTTVSDITGGQTVYNDLSFSLWAQALQRSTFYPMEPSSVNGVPMFTSTAPRDAISLENDAVSVPQTWRGGYGKYSAFATVYLDYQALDPRDSRDFSHAGMAFGTLHRDYPTMGSATWRGAMVGRVKLSNTPLVGRSLLEYDFSGNTLNLTLDGITEEESGDPWLTTEIVWEGLRANSDGSFYIPGYGNDKDYDDVAHRHLELGYVDGDFYGPNAAEFAGVFERDAIIGAFGGKRDTE